MKCLQQNKTKVDTTIFDGDDNPPKYEDHQPSKENAINVLQSTHSHLVEVASKHQIIVVDDNFRFKEKLKRTLQLLHFKLNAKSVTTFTRYSN